MCLYVKKTNDDIKIIVVYVDDLLVTGTSSRVVGPFFKNMAFLSRKKLGIINRFLSS